MIRKISLVILAGLSCGVMHGAANWVGQQIDAVTLATGLRQPTAGEQFQQVVHEVGQGVSSFLNDLTAPSSAPSSSNSTVSSSPSPRVPSARAIQRQELYAQEREQAQRACDERRAALEAKYRPTSGAAPILASSSQQVGLIQQDALTPETSCKVLARMLNENKEAVIVVGGISTAALLGFAFYALKK